MMVKIAKPRLMYDGKDRFDKAFAVGPVIESFFGLLADVVDVNHFHDVVALGEVVNAISDLGQNAKDSHVARCFKSEIAYETVPKGVMESLTDAMKNGVLSAASTTLV